MKNYNSFFFKTEKLFLFLLFLFSILINQYYGNLGVSPLDSFSHFDTGYRILNGQFPFKDFWVISGPILDYFQSILFFIFGINWQSYVLQGSLINAILTLATYFILKKFNLDLILCFFYSFLFSILAYPSSGTPFVDHHAALFSLLCVYFCLLALKTENKIFYILFPLLLGFAFLSKIVPSSYVIFFVGIIIIFYSVINKKISLLKYALITMITFVLLLSIILKVQGITILSFLVQYILHPLTVGDDRVGSLNLTFSNIILHFKFIYIVFLPFVYFQLNDILKQNQFYKKKDFYYFLIIIALVLSLITHQVLTQNQTFIFFLIPVLAAFSHLSINFRKRKFNLIRILLVLICIYSTTKYHYRFNEGRKFHDLNHLNFNLIKNGESIDKKLSGLKWISPEFPSSPEKEIIFLKKLKKTLKEDKRKKILITHYAFFSGILDENLHSPVRWYLKSGQTSPKPSSEYFNYFKDFVLKKIKENQIEVIYVVKPLNIGALEGIIDKKCLQSSDIDENIKIHLIVKCNDLK